MDPTKIFGFCLIALSAVLLALHWQTWQGHSRETMDPKRERFLRTQLRRRTQASALIGIVGLSLTLADRIPRTAGAMSAYLFGLVFMACWMLWIALADIASIRSQGQKEDIDRLKKSADRRP